MKKKCEKCPYEEGIAVFEGWAVGLWCFGILLLFYTMTLLQWSFWSIIGMSLIFSIGLGIILHNLKLKGCPRNWQRKNKNK